MKSVSTGQVVDRVQDQARAGAQQGGPALVALGRLGFACKGLVYLLIGILAGQAALGTGGQTTDPQGVLGRLVEAPFGQVVLAIVAVGLVGYGLWRFVQAGADTERKGTEPKGLWVRAGYAVSGFIHLALAFAAFTILQGGDAGGGSDQTAQDNTARLMEQPLGQALVVILGFGVLGVAGFQLFRAYKADFRKKLNSGQMSSAETTFATRTGRMGYAARGITFGITGLFLVIAGIQHEPGQARGLAGALDTLAAQAYGPILLAIVAVGLAAYGLYMFVEARYRRMVLPPI